MITLHPPEWSLAFSASVWLWKSLVSTSQIKLPTRQCRFYTYLNWSLFTPAVKSPVIEDMMAWWSGESGAIHWYLIDKFGGSKFAPARGTASEYVGILGGYCWKFGHLPMLLKIFVMKMAPGTKLLPRWLCCCWKSKDLTFVNEALEGKTYLVGETLSLVPISWCHSS